MICLQHFDLSQKAKTENFSGFTQVNSTTLTSSSSRGSSRTGDIREVVVLLLHEVTLLLLLCREAVVEAVEVTPRTPPPLRHLEAVAAVDSFVAVGRGTNVLLLEDDIELSEAAKGVECRAFL